MSKILTIIDADSLCYLGSSSDTATQVLQKVDSKISSILEETNADFYILIISKMPYFRHEISMLKESKLKEYKAGRNYEVQRHAKMVKEYLISSYNAVYYPMLEADDIVAFLYTKQFYFENEKVNSVLAAIDKDLLNSIPGKHLNYNKKINKSTWRLEWVITTEEEAMTFRKKQMIIGDSVDGIKGIPGKGVKYWDKLCENAIPTWAEIFNEYIEAFGESEGIYQFQKNYRLLHLLSSDEDYLREVGYIPEIPLFKKVRSIDF